MLYEVPRNSRYKRTRASDVQPLSVLHLAEYLPCEAYIETLELPLLDDFALLLEDVFAVDNVPLGISEVLFQPLTFLPRPWFRTLPCCTRGLTFRASVPL